MCRCAGVGSSESKEAEAAPGFGCSFQLRHVVVNPPTLSLLLVGLSYSVKT